jgi:hypothetical protein
MFIFGKLVNPGVLGNNPDLNNLSRGNLTRQFDYRQVFTSAIVDWLQADTGAIEATMFGDWVDSRLPIIGNGITGTHEAFLSSRNYLQDCYPNPVAKETVFGFRTNNTGRVTLQLMDLQGKLIAVILDETREPGLHHVTFGMENYRAGTYLFHFKSGTIEQTKKLVKI